MRYLIPSLAILLFFSSCSSNSKSELAVSEAITRSFKESNKTISFSNQSMHRILDERLTDPKTSDRTKFWKPKADRVSDLALVIVNYIKALKYDLCLEGGYKLNGNDIEYDNPQAVYKIFDQKNKGIELYNKLNDFVSGTRSVDEKLNAEFKGNMDYMYNYLDSGENAAQNFSKMFFGDVSLVRALAMLEKIENDILNTENKMISYCYYNTFPMICGYVETFSAIMGQSSNCVKAGDYIVLTAGVGSFSMASQPRFTIDGKLVNPTADAVAEYKFKTPSEAGKYSVPVKIEYTKPDGTKETMERNIEYTVVDPDKK